MPETYLGLYGKQMKKQMYLYTLNAPRKFFKAYRTYMRL